MNITLDLKAPIVHWSGEELPGSSLGKSLASILGGEQSQDEQKIHKLPTWARDCFVKETLTVDEPDLKYIKDIVVASNKLEPFVRSPLILAIDEAKEKAAKESTKKAEKASNK